MIAKVITANSFKATLEYLTQDEKNSQVILSYGVRGYDVTKTITDFVEQSKDNSRIKTEVFHASFSFHSQDKTVVEKQGREIMESYLARLKEKGVNIDETQHILIRHNDKDHPHFHLVANMVKDDGRRLEIGNVGYKMTSISRGIEKAFKLTPGIRKEYQEETVKQGYNVSQAISAVKAPKPTKQIIHERGETQGFNPNRKEGKRLKGPSL